jgi:hypothetical protein
LIVLLGFVFIFQTCIYHTLIRLTPLLLYFDPLLPYYSTAYSGLYYIIIIHRCSPMNFYLCLWRSLYWDLGSSYHMEVGLLLPFQPQIWIFLLIMFSWYTLNVFNLSPRCSWEALLNLLEHPFPLLINNVFFMVTECLLRQLQRLF